MINIENEKIVSLFKKYNVDGFVNINIANSKSLEYSPLYDEISFDSSHNINTSVTIIKEHKKSVFWIDGYSLEKIESAIKDMLKLIDFAEFDEDIILPQITDRASKDFSNNDLENITFSDLEKEFEKFKNYKFKNSIKIEAFSIWVNYTTHIYINSLWSQKTQKDNWAFYYADIFWENWEFRDNHYKYVQTKQKPEIKLEDLDKLQEELLFKIWGSKSKIASWNYDITLHRDVVIDFLDIILWNMWAESIREWISLFSKNQLWDKIFWDNFTLVNNPELKNYTWTMLFDEEWVTAKKTTLFDKWVFVSKFYDYKNAIKEWLDKLWNSTISNIELIWETDKNYAVWSKILFTNLMAFHTVDTSTWKFSLNWEWYILENWEKKDYIKNISLSGDIISLFSNIKAIWDDFKEDWNFKVPSITFKNQKVI